MAPKKKKPTSRKKTTTRKKSPPVETFDFCDGIFDDDGNPAVFSDKERLFVLNYLTDANFNAAQSARLAGYDAKSENAFRVIGCQMMKKTKIRSAINNGLEALTMPKFETLYRLAQQAAASIDDVTDEKGLFDPVKARDNGAIHNIQSIEIDERIIEVSSESIETPDDLNLPADERPEKETLEKSVIQRKTKIKMYSSQTALKILTDVHFAKKHAITDGDGNNLPVANVSLYLPDNNRGDSPAELAEKAQSPTGSKK